MPTDRDRVTVSRALRAGGVAAAATALLLLVAAIVAGVGYAAALTGGLAIGSVVAAGWLLLAALLDILAKDFPGPRRLAWTVGAAVVALVSPFLVLAALLSA